MTIRALTDEIETLTQRRNRLAADIRGQQRLLEQIRERVAVAQRDRLTESTTVFDEQVAKLNPWEQESRAGLIQKLRKRAAAGEEVGDLRVLCRESRIER